MIKSAVILAGSNPANRGQLIEGLSRTMLPALGKPMIARVMDQLYRAGIRHFVVIVGMSDGAVASYLNTSWVPDAKVDFLLKHGGESFSQQFKGIATRINAPFLLTTYNNFVYDAFIKTLLAIHEDDPDMVILSGTKSKLIESQKPYFAQVEDDLITDIVQQQGHTEQVVLNELSICGQSLIDYPDSISSSQSSNHDYFELLNTYRMAGHPIRFAGASWMLQVENDADLLQLNRQLLGNSNDAHILSELPRSVRVIPPVRIDPGVTVGQNAVIGPYAYLEKGARIGDGATVENAVILARAFVTSHSHVNNLLLAPAGSIRG